MPIVQSGGGVFSTGRDCVIVIVHPTFGPVELDNVTSFDAKQDVVKLKSRRLDGVKLNASLPDGWSGSLDVDRGTPALDALANLIEAGWIDAGIYNNATMYQYITEVTGLPSIWAYDNVALSLPDAGKWAADAITKQRLDFTANRRRLIG